jgi:PAS domain S-box-containing protein
MKLDPKSIMFAIIIGNLLMSFGLYLVAHVYVGQVQGVLRWSRACVIQATGWIVVGALRGVIPDLISIVLGQVLILTALIMYLTVLADFTQQTIAKRWIFLPIAAEIIGLSFFTAVQLDLPTRVAIISICCGSVMCKTIAVLLKKNSQSSSISSKFTAFLYLMCASYMIFRALYYFVAQPKGPQLAFAQNTINDISYIVFFIFAVMLTFGFVLMCTERYIAQQNMAIQEKAEHHALFSKLSQQIPGVIYQYRLYPDGHASFPFASEGIQQIYEVTPEQVREDGKPVLAVLHPEDKQAVLESITASARSMRAWQLEFRVILPKQGVRWRRGDAKPEKLPDGSILWHGFITDITEQALVKEKQKQLEQEVRDSYEALVASELRLRRLMNSSMIGIIQGRLDGQLLEANEILLQMIGHNRQDVDQGRLNWYSMTDFDARATQEAAIAQLVSSGHTRQFESQIIARNGTLIPIMLGLAHLEGSNSDWVGFIVDLREQKRIDQMKAEFISIVSHELRTPLTSIRGSLGLLEGGIGGELPPKAMQLISIAHKNSQRLVALVNDILDMEKLATGKMQINLHPVDLVALAQHAMEANAGYAQTFRVHFHLLTSEAKLMVFGDSDRLMQVFANLLSNAAKFSLPGGKIEIRVTQHGEAALVEIEDHGRGIPFDFHGHIFGKFAQADAADTRHVEGAGLGLNITKTLIEKMHGDIGFTSEVGVKTVFWFRLPLAAD